MESVKFRVYFNDDEYLDDVHFRSPAGSRETVRPGQLVLRFLALVDPSRIPLQLVAGPNLVFESANERHIGTISTLLGLDQAHESHHRLDAETESAAHTSICGALFKVDRSSLDKTDSTTQCNITELLIYGSSRETDGLTTFPRSKSQHDHVIEEADTEVSPTISIFALPLCSKFLLGSVSSGEEPPSPPSEAYFFSSEPLTQDPSPNVKKRTRLGDLFDQASDRQKMVRHKGGQSISLAASRHASATPFPQMGAFDGVAIKLEDSGDSETLSSHGKNGGRIRTDSKDLKKRAQLTTLEPRPKSSKGFSAASSTSRSFVALDSGGVAAEAALQDTSTESKNKKSISRIVMAGMRIYGLQQSRNRSSTRRKEEHLSGAGADDEASDGPIKTSAGTTSDEQQENDEFKEIYHQTYKATTFTFRRIMATSLLQPDSVRDTVDKFLAIFCNDPQMNVQG